MGGYAFSLWITIKWHKEKKAHKKNNNCCVHLLTRTHLLLRSVSLGSPCLRRKWWTTRWSYGEVRSHHTPSIFFTRGFPMALCKSSCEVSFVLTWHSTAPSTARSPRGYASVSGELWCFWRHGHTGSTSGNRSRCLCAVNGAFTPSGDFPVPLPDLWWSRRDPSPAPEESETPAHLLKIPDGHNLC